MSAEEKFSIEALARRAHDIIETFNAHDLDGLAASYAEDAVLFEPTYPEAQRGREAIRQDAEAILAAVPDARIIVEDLMVQDDKAAARLVTVGTHTGPFTLPDGQELPPTGNEVRLRYSFFDRYNADGLIIEEHRYTDVAEMLRQFGVGD